MSYLLSALAGEEMPDAIDGAFESLAPGGRLIVHDFCLDDDGQGPGQAALWFLQYLAYRTDSISFCYRDIEKLAENAGFDVIHSAPLIHEITGVVVAVKPA